ncbi:BatA domain-containing protein [Salinimicrobium sp. HB62]|uniref:BatA domain-containing protein n=1 Tax=Salinimicrobium sp. HB62 TaxID=3077781 RepID=UPI002D778569|nr:BatA domain-containing protein [Salinimicrobium sp. HB62]
MYFKHPELLYALFLLLIPILVHLFQLRKFRTTEFTNVKFLQKAVSQTRKSSRLKKFLILCTRLLMLACIVLAFAQPYFPPTSGEIKEMETVIYLDDSYSMQARGKNGILLRRSIQDLLVNIPQEETVSLFTNNEEYREVKIEDLREKLQDKNFSSKELSRRAVELKAQNLFKGSPNTQKNFIAISDFQHFNDSLDNLTGEVETHLVHLLPENQNNISVDSAWVSNKSIDEVVLSVALSGTGELREEISVGLYEGQKMLARKTVALEEDLKEVTTFSLKPSAIPYGRIEVEDNGLQFDNRLYFSINENSPVKVVFLGDSEADYLERIYSAPDFELNIFSENNLDYNLLSQANLVVLNQLKNLPVALVNTLEQLQEEQVFLVIIPSTEADTQKYNLLFRSLGLPLFGAANEEEMLVTDIIFEHPLYRDVFSETIRNFEYPRVQRSFPVNAVNSSILKYQNGLPFLYEQDNVFVFTSSLNRENSNFRNAPLIVPTFYNIGNMAVSMPQLYHLLGRTQRISIQANLQKDEILKLSSGETPFIPQQQSFQNKVELVLEDLPAAPGHYDVLQESTSLRTLSFNISRTENDPIKDQLEEREGVTVHSSIPQVFSEIKSANEVESLWKWFVIFTLFFLLTEMLILKFLK